MDYSNSTLRELLSNREVFAIFDEEFHKGTWLDVTALQASESRISDLHAVGTVPADVLDRIEARLSQI